jgi:hypothetical protein
MSIAQEVVEIKTWGSKNGGSQAIQDFIGNYRKCILIQNLAQCAEIWESIDTTPTTTSLSRLFGYVLRAIENYTNSDTMVRAEQKSEQSRFLYCPKASRSERNAGLEGMPKQKIDIAGQNSPEGRAKRGRNPDGIVPVQNHHPTVKPIALMEYLVRLTKTPTGGVVLDPFMGSGTTGIACVNEGRDFIGIEQGEEYFEIAKRRIEYAQNELKVDLPLLELIEDEQ